MLTEEQDGACKQTAQNARISGYRSRLLYSQHGSKWRRARFQLHCENLVDSVYQDGLVSEVKGIRSRHLAKHMESELDS